MPALKIPTRIKAIVVRLEPLANWLKQNKPDNRIIHVSKRDWLVLIQAPIETLRPAGFNVTSENGLTYGRFTLRPVDQTITKGE